MVKNKPTKEYLLKNINRNCSDIAMEFGCCYETIRSLYKKYNIEKINKNYLKNKPSKEYLIENMNRTSKDIANEFGCSDQTIRNLYKQYDIDKTDLRLKEYRKNKR